MSLLGILGGGQLGRMSAQAAIRLGLSVRTLSPKPAGPVEALGEAMVGDWTDPDVLQRFAEGCTAVTVESEWAPAEHLRPVLPSGVRLYPTPETLRIIRHKGRQRSAMHKAGIPGADFRRCASKEDAGNAAESFGYPVVLKRYEGSYDGYGNGIAHSRDDIEDIWDRLSGPDGLLVEAFVPFKQELSVLVVRRETGDMVSYPPAYTEQKNARCHAVVVPANISPETAARADEVARAAAETVQSVGVLGVELFETEDGHILLNELAPRPHNTGHYSIEGSHTSQFENHVRAVMGLPLGDPGLRVPCAVMINVLGTRSGAVSLETLPDALDVPGAAVHIYGKKEARPDRKMGHVTATGSDPAETRARAEKAASRIIL
ncbi:MAG: 5-(carboxyamino)imidazole ribonucleotide synthase [Rhodothermales bacterium]|nr:5-(carboxyamino)imidazole ribonucleotide synthase [Rhodothermales bacterium]MBO6779859.1 5-(carboxyamino)imidazole ribonucleotide synthase [Rhodothermales bacterium]